ncbi:MAG TPA: DUF5615 family PIN-like protein [Oscillatoriaceae cyanobacterium M33_DOE_052]|uniref:DUF5615 domain-containing protein n=1 Tax=Planktothricoides sp. SpSt-374 TaxID=2282167 RepID=A0A7C3ZPQ4_9CYAN|nr:DUF5615 family PIN-like protein [Oscillatoriaceae cyanobacterium M33_DOE_052]
MRILADENFPADAVAALRYEGYDVVWIRTDAPGSSDTQLLARAQVENRIIVTFDKDFGELAFKFGLPADSGIILFRFRPLSPAIVAQRVVATLSSRTDWAGYLAVVEEDRIRIKPFAQLS